MGIFDLSNIIQESYVINGNDLILNIEKWKKGSSNNILYVTGLSGSGKSTLSEEYEKKYNAIMFEIDGLEHGYDSSNKGILDKVKKKFPEYDKYVKNNFKDVDDDERANILEKILLHVISEMYADKDTLYILEGIQIFEWLNPNTLKSKPMIIKGTSMLTSMKRRLEREGNGKIDWIAELSKEFPQLFSLYMSDTKQLSKFKKEIVKENTIIEEGVIIQEAASERRYKCPYCDYRDTRENLVYHVDEHHEDMVPQDYSAARVVFNYVNKKENGSCIICKKATNWNDVTWKYERLCIRQVCHDKYVQIAKTRMVDKYGKEHLLGSMEVQKVMLSKRKISGTYKFTNGEEKSYTGSYERKTLEFLDKVMNFPSEDVQTPGPIIEYEYNGETLSWILDIHLLSCNLVMDVKDGGDNPNNRNMPDYRAKQEAKEKAIAKLGKYNYLRLTDNNFPQLLSILAELKRNLLDNEDKQEQEVLIRINEDTTVATIPQKNYNDVYIIPYMMNNTFAASGIAFANDLYLNNIFTIENDKIVRRDREFLEYCNYDIYKYTGGDAKEKYLTVLKNIKEGTEIEDEYYFYKLLSGKDMLSNNQYMFDDNFEHIEDIYSYTLEQNECIEATANHQFNSILEENVYLDILDSKELAMKSRVLREHNNLDIKQDVDGVFVYNPITESRSKSYSNIGDIPNVVYDILESLNTRA
jgi:hypothetical protein